VIIKDILNDGSNSVLSAGESGAVKILEVSRPILAVTVSSAGSYSVANRQDNS